MATWCNSKLPTPQDADLHGMVLWGKQDGLLMHWKGVRAQEYWAHTSAWKPSRSCERQ